MYGLLVHVIRIAHIPSINKKKHYYNWIIYLAQISCPFYEGFRTVKTVHNFNGPYFPTLYCIIGHVIFTYKYLKGQFREKSLGFMTWGVALTSAMVRELVFNFWNGVLTNCILLSHACELASVQSSLSITMDYTFRGKSNLWRFSFHNIKMFSDAIQNCLHVKANSELSVHRIYKQGQHFKIS